eukprot:TRINITY_DN20978_c0_g1_i2.p1 TRINITY_DN20978_c0_g1~~TRINITY_DN20978_c0_g1_i2.p1  ORF type:complete len:570 (-),score=89.34 TRINITY_DN20978_c0_g1_i2:291-2000(-)
MWRHLPNENLLWVSHPGDDALLHAELAAEEAKVSIDQVISLEKLDKANYLLLELPFFTKEQLGAAHHHGPVGLDVIVYFAGYLRGILQDRCIQAVPLVSSVASKPLVLCLGCTQRPGAVANSLLLLGSFLILETGIPAQDAINMLLGKDVQGGDVALQEQQFPTPFCDQVRFTHDSLTVQDCLFGLQSALEHGWLDYNASDMHSRRRDLLAFDCVPVFKVSLQDQLDCDTVSFWVAADPVTTVINSDARPDPPDSSGETGAASEHSQTRAVSQDVRMRAAHSHARAGSNESSRPKRLGMISEMSQASYQSHASTGWNASLEWLGRSAAWTQSETSLGQSLRKQLQKVVSKSPTTPTKIHSSHEISRPEDLPSFARWLKQQLACKLLVRANFSTERGLPAQGSYSDFFHRWGIRQLELAIPDGTAPPFSTALALVNEVQDLVRDLTLVDSETSSYSIVVHCKSGLGRSMTMLGVLAVAFTPGLSSSAFFGWSRLVRPGSIQTHEQERFLRALDEEPKESCFSSCFRTKRISRGDSLKQTVCPELQNSPTKPYTVSQKDVASDGGGDEWGI